MTTARTGAATLTVAGLHEDLRLMVAETPESEWCSDVEALIGRPLSSVETGHVLHSLHALRRAPGMRMWQESVVQLARLLVFGGMK